MRAVQVLYAEGGEGVVAGGKGYAKVAEGTKAWTRVGEGETKRGGWGPLTWPACCTRRVQRVRCRLFRGGKPAEFSPTPIIHHITHTLLFRLQANPSPCGKSHAAQHAYIHLLRLASGVSVFALHPRLSSLYPLVFPRSPSSGQVMGSNPGVNLFFLQASHFRS